MYQQQGMICGYWQHDDCQQWLTYNHAGWVTCWCCKSWQLWRKYYGDVNHAIDDWSKHHNSSPLQNGIQVAWDELACRDTLNSLLNTNNSWNHCRLLAAQESHTADWSEAFPIASFGNLLSPEELRITIALRTGAKIFESTKCRCSKIVDELGLHGLSCTKNAGHLGLFHSCLQWSHFICYFALGVHCLLF